MADKPSTGAVLNAGHALATNLAMALLFNEGSGTTVTDYSGNGHTGTINATALSWASSVFFTGAYAHALASAATTGTTKLSIANWCTTNINGPWTMALWLRNAGSDSYGQILGRDNPIDTGLYAHASGAGYKMNFFQTTDHDGTTVLSHNTNYRLVVTASTTQVKYYIDTVLDATISLTTPRIIPNTMFNDLGSQTFIGQVDLAYFWSGRELDATEIATLDANPFDMFDEVIAPLAATLLLGTVNPTVVLGGVTTTPAASSLLLGTVNPSVLNPVNVTPAASTLLLRTLNPNIPGAIRITPAVSRLVLGTANPLVLAEAVVTPAPAVLLLQTAGPLPAQTAFAPISSPALFGRQELVLASHYSLRRRLLAPQRVLAIGGGAQAVRRLAETPTYEFALHDRQRVQSDAEALYAFAQVHQGDTPFWFGGNRWGSLSTPVLFGEGDGATREFALNNRHIFEDTLTVYANEVEIPVASVDWEAGRVRFEDAPAPEVALTAIYDCRYLCVFGVQQEALLSEELFYHKLFSYEGLLLRELLTPATMQEGLEEWEYSPPAEALLLTAEEDWET